ncbi:aminotransferase class-V family protein [[Clostridium] bifermentans ATCC 638]|uniref:Aminotransferase class-V family protein n=1 Tax=Paraclostridium bifermentans ATCC 638 = DSM 14991 TaxID=1233171 RepID=T4VIE0_PARBF|nr:aminotransferase class I/II-fold pyridoxal phosphate-dependent enzyme [Paraclostridium bifermentans]EQK40880.1 aminotransferase class-V family protein [[Clostridium] bifermentans ATCC 638] [Paraclostridium bifermentans ATCC 638 = DSM 14991]RIZ58142.1 arginine decarboxylase [Paraclostridium bifermentans]UAG18306.1 aminotransferase class I/II-fold pyridoxal phosphate-dependent enzyme [Paraclostridium bifermentans]
MNTPIIDSLRKIVDDNIISFHMPGHKKGAIYKMLGYEDILENLYKLDTTEIPGTDNLHSPEECIKESLKRASEVFKSDKTFYLVNGSTCGIEAAIMASVNPKEKIILNRDCHQSAINSCIIGDIDPIYVNPSINKDSNTLSGVSFNDVKSVIDSNLDAKAVFLTYPTYFGDVFDLKSICSYAHEKGMTVIIDEAHGAHLGLSEKLPETALSQGADIVIQSTHKTLPSFTQSSMIHIKGNRIDINKLTNMLRITESSSPSYLLMASLDIAVDIYEKNGFDLMDKLLNNIYEFKNETYKLKNIKVDESKDHTKIFLNTKKLGITGHELENILRENYNIQVELSNYYGVLLIATIGNTKDEFLKLKDVLFEIDKIYKKESHLKSVSYPIKLPKKILTPREAFYMNKKNVKIENSIGKISGEYIIPYPPGVSLVSPGEEITREVIDYIIECKSKGMNVNGVKDSELRFIQVIDID